MSPLPRIFAFGRRFLPFWLVWLLIGAFPSSREVLSLHLFGSPLTPRINPPWRDDIDPDRRFDSFALVKRIPKDLNARVWRFSQMLEGKAEGFDKEGQQNSKSYSSPALIAEAEAIQNDFPQEKWLQVLSLRALRHQFLSRRISAARAQQLTELTRQGELLEPGNAYYPFREAEFWRRSGDEAAMWAALSRAAQGKTFDSHELDWARALVKAHDAARPLLLEEREALSESLLGSEWTTTSSGYWLPFLLLKARQAQKTGDHRRAVEIGVILGSIGDLMQRGTNTPATAAVGREWKMQLNLLVFRTYPPKPRKKPVLWAQNFSAYAAAHGRPDVVAMRKRWLAREKQLDLSSTYSTSMGRVMPSPIKDAAWRAGGWRGAGAVVGAQFIFVLLGWLLVNLVLWRGVGAPSSSRDRIMPALLMVGLSLGMALWCWQQMEIVQASRWTPTRMRYELAIFSVAVVAFFGAPFLLAIWCVAITLWRHRKQFLKPARIETELRLSPHQATILKSGPTIFCAVSLLTTLLLWLLYLSLVAFDFASFDPLAWLPDDGRPTRWSSVIPVEALMAGVVYGLFLSFLGFLLWFNKWRYYTAKESRPLTHGGLRLWKETIGIYLVLSSAIYLGIALIGWPARAEAARDLETRMVRGELAL